MVPTDTAGGGLTQAQARNDMLRQSPFNAAALTIWRPTDPAPVEGTATTHPALVFQTL